MSAKLREAAMVVASVLAAIVVAAVVGELAVRVYEKQPLWPLVPPKPYVDSRLLYEKSPTRLYSMRPGVDDEIGYERVRIRINRFGFRSTADPAVPKPAGTWRAVVLGDSFTFSGKVPLEQTFGAQLQAMLDARDRERRHEVLNLGVPGYKIGQQLALLRETAPMLDPDLVIFDFTLNAAAPLVQLVPATEPRWPWLNRFMKRFHLVQFLMANMKQYAYLRDGNFFARGKNFADLAPDSARWAAAKADLAAMKEVAARRGAKLVVVMWPVFVELDDYPYAAKHELVMRACQELNIPAVDLLPAFRGASAHDLWVRTDDHHPNQAAQRKAAETVLAALAERGLVPG